MKNEKSNFGFFLMKIMVNFEAFDWNFSLSTNPEIEGRVTILLSINSIIMRPNSFQQPSVYNILPLLFILKSLINKILLYAI